MEAHSEMVRALAKPGEEILADLDPGKCHALHMVVGLMGEAAELSIAQTRENEVEELGDIEFYLEGLRQETGHSYEDALKFSELMADARTSVVSAAGDVLDCVKRVVIYNKKLDADQLPKALGLLEYNLQRFRDSARS